MCHDWCSATKYSLDFVDIGGIETSKTNEFLKREAELDAKFKAGSCTAGDMKYTRHRNTRYINEYTCRNQCLDCGTVWID